MNSFNGDDPTLPVDFDGSADPGDLTEVTFGQPSHLENPDGTKPMVFKVNSGRLSPIRARSMKEYEQNIADLSKENFNLKLRIYFLEEKVKQKFEGGEDLQKINIDLKVETEHLKKQLADKQELLKKASTVLGSISSKQKAELEEVLQSAQRENEELQEKLRQSEEELEDYQQKLEEFAAKNRDLETKLGGSALLGLHEENNEFLLAEKDRLIEELRTDLKEKEQALEDLELEKDDAAQPLHEALHRVRTELELKDQEVQVLKSQLNQSEAPGDGSRMSGSGFDRREIQELLEKYQVQVGELEQAVDQMTHDLTDKDAVIEDLEKKMDEMDRDHRSFKDNALKRDRAIQGLTLALQEKTKEVQQLSCQLEDKEVVMDQLKEDLHEMQMERYQGADEQLEKLQAAEEQLSHAEEQLRDMKLDHERLQKTVSRREAEVSRLTNQLQKADEALKQRDDQLQDLRFQIQEEKNKSMEKSESLDQHYQVLLEDTQRQLQNKEKMLQRLTRSLQDKDKQLQEQIAAQSQSPNESYEGLVKSLQARLKEREHAIQEGQEDKFKCLEEKDAEIRQQKNSLREKERDIERANHQLLTSEETIDSLQNEMKEKDQNMKQLAFALKVEQRALQDANDTNARAIEEKDSIIKRLQNSVTSKDRELREAFNQSPSAKEVVIQQLQERQRAKDKLLEEIMSERSKAALANEQATKDLLIKLNDKDHDIKELTERYNAELTEQSRAIQRLTTDLNKRDYDLQTTENRNTWAEEQQQEMLDKMRAALNEKDKTIEVLVESGREKDKLFRQMVNATPNQDGLSASKLAEIQMLKDDVARLSNQLQNKDDLIERLRSARDSRSPQAFRQLEQRLQDTQQELVLACNEVDEAREQLETLRGSLQNGGMTVTEKARLEQEIAELRQRIQQKAASSSQTAENVANSGPRRLQTTGADHQSAQVQHLLEEQLNDVEQLSEALKSEQQIYQQLKQNIPNSDPGQAFVVELGEVQTLRKQLEDGVHKNNELRLLLQIQVDKSPQQDSGDNNEKSDIRLLQSQLEEANRWNSSLQARLNQQNTRAGGVGGASSMSDMASAGGDSHGGRRSDSLSDAEVARMNTPELRDRLLSLRSQLSASQDSETSRQDRVSQLASPDLGDDLLTEISDADVELMTPEELRDAVHRMQGKLGRLSLERMSSTGEDGNEKVTRRLTRDELAKFTPRQLRETILMLQDSTPDLTQQHKVNAGQMRMVNEQVTRLSDQLEASVAEQQRLKMQLQAASAGGDAAHSDGEDSLDGFGQKPVLSMNSPELRQTVKALRAQLRRSYNNNQHLQEQLNELADMRSDIPGQTDEEQSAGLLRQRVDVLEGQVTATQTEKKALSQQLHAILNAPTAGIDVRTVPVLRQQLEDTVTALNELKQENKALRRQLGVDEEADIDYRSLSSDMVDNADDGVESLRRSLCEAERVNTLLKQQIQLDTQTDKSSAGFNPQLIVDMAEEIERLKSELCSAKEKLVTSESAKPSKLPVKKQIPTSTVNKAENSQSAKGALSTSAVAALKSQMEALKTELNDSLVQNKVLHGKLASTETLVRNQTEKVRYYRGMLEDAGLAPRSPKKSSSESNLSTLAEMSHSEANLQQKPSRIPRRVQRMSSSQENLSHKKRDRSPGGSETISPATSLRSLTASSWENYGQTDDVKELKDQMRELLDQMERYKRMIRNLQTRPRPPVSPTEGIERATSPVFLTPPPARHRLSLVDQAVSPCRELVREDQETINKLTGNRPPDVAGRQSLTPPLILTHDASGDLDDSTLMANQEAFRQLQREVDDLRGRLKETEDANLTLQDELRDARDLNATMQDQLNATMAGFLTDQSFLPLPQTLNNKPAHADTPADSHSVAVNTTTTDSHQGAAGQAHDIAVLRKQLSDSQNMCSSLRLRLEELADFLAEMLPQDEQGEVTFIDITADRVTSLKDILHQSMDMCAVLGTNLEVEAQANDLPTDEISHRVSLHEAQQNYAGALREIDDLRLQLRQTQATLKVQQTRLTADSKSSNTPGNVNESQETTRLQQSVSAALKARQALEHDNLQLKKTIAQLEKTEKELQAKYKHMAEEKSKMSAAHDKMAARCEKMCIAHDKKNAECEQMAVACDRMRAERDKAVADGDKMAATHKSQMAEHRARSGEQELLIKRMQKDSVAMKKELQEISNQEQVLRQQQSHLKKDNSEKSQENQRLRELIKKNQSIAEQTREKLHRMSSEVNKKNDMIAKLQDKLRHRSGRVSGNRGAAPHQPITADGTTNNERDLDNQRSSKTASSSPRGLKGQLPKSLMQSNESVESIERERHRSASGAMPHHDGSSVYAQYQTSLDNLVEDNLSAHSSVDKSLGPNSLTGVRPSGMDVYHSLMPGAELDRDVEGSQTDDGFGKYLTPSLPDYHESQLGSMSDIVGDSDKSGKRRTMRKNETSSTSMHSSRSSLGALEERDALEQVPGQDLIDQQGNVNLNKSPVSQQFDLHHQTRLSPVDRADYLDRYNGITDAAQSLGSSSLITDKRPQGHKIGSDYRPVVGQSSDSETISMLRQELQVVRIKLKSLEDVNKTLKSELQLYDSMKTSVGIQSSPKTGSHGSQTTTDQSLNLQEHLQEIRALRKQLLKSIKNNDRLGEKLEKQLNTRHSTGNMSNVYISERTSERTTRTSESSETVLPSNYSELLKTQISEKDKELRVTENKLTERNEKISKLDKQIQDLNQALANKDKHLKDLQSLRKENKVLHRQCDHMTSELRQVKNQLKLVKEELNVSRQQEAENVALNTTLQAELDMYDRLHRQDADNKDQERSRELAGNSSDLDLKLLLEEIKELRTQLQRSIQTNNALRQKLEEQLSRDLTAPPGSVINIHHKTSNVTSDLSVQQHTSGYQKYPENGILHPQNSNETRTDSYTDRTEKFTSDFQTDSAFLNKPDLSSGSSMGRGRSVSGPEGPVTRGQGSRGHDLGSSRSRMHSEPDKRPDQMDRLAETGSSDGLLTTRDLDMNGANIRPHYAASHDKYGHQRYPSKLSPENKSATAGGRGASDENSMRYHIHDVRPYPGVPSSVRVDSDLRQLYAIGKIDDYELLKKEVAESKVVLSAIERRLQEQLVKYQSLNTSESAEYRMLKELSSAVENERICLNEVSRNLALFWLSQLPVTQDGIIDNTSSDGNIFKEQISSLHMEVSVWKKKYKNAWQMLQETRSRLKENNRKKEGVEAAICTQLQKTHLVLKRAKGNLEDKARTEGLYGDLEPSSDDPSYFI